MLIAILVVVFFSTSHFLSSTSCGINLLIATSKLFLHLLHLYLGVVVFLIIKLYESHLGKHSFNSRL